MSYETTGNLNTDLIFDDIKESALTFLGMIMVLWLYFIFNSFILHRLKGFTEERIRCPEFASK